MAPAKKKDSNLVFLSKMPDGRGYGSFRTRALTYLGGKQLLMLSMHRFSSPFHCLSDTHYHCANLNIISCLAAGLNSGNC